MGTHSMSRRGVVLRVAGGLTGAVLIVVGSFGTGFSVGEAKAPRTVVETRTVPRLPDSCSAALADAVNGLGLARAYDEEMRSLHERDGGIHYFRPGDPGGHYDTAQEHHRNLTAAHEAFTAAREQCEGGAR